ncbi:hypothetical protein [Kribbella sp. CA-294648]|uniref:hypothetical protein n=1 Tax=Kribbella sp. CA-294648 TaxID=3239948 RepID=UPI003D8C801E
MRRYFAVVATGVLVAVTGLAPAGAAASYPATAGAGTLTVELDKTQAAVGLGQTLKFTSTVGNSGADEVTGAIAHLNVLAVDPGVYVDPEDWSGERTQYLDPIGAGEAEPLEWEMQAVNSGRFVVYVAITFAQTAGEVVASKSLRLDVAAQDTMNSSGLLPIAAGAPGLIAVLMALVLLRRRRYHPLSTTTNPKGEEPNDS